MPDSFLNDLLNDAIITSAQFAGMMWRQTLPRYFFWSMMLVFAVWLFYRGFHKDA